jgi:hypothetical protein
MERALNDNALLNIARLEKVDRIYSLIQRVAVMAVIGFIWFLCVAVPAKAIWQ